MPSDTPQANPDPTTPPAIDTPAARKGGGLGRKAGRGVLWMMFATLVAKLGSFISQMILGWLLLKEDFGVYSIALGITSLVQVFRDAGIREVLIQRGARRYDSLSGPAFWFGAAINVAAGGVLALAAPFLAAVYDAPVLSPLLIVMALSIVLHAPAAVFRAKMALDLQFNKLGVFHVVSAAARYISLIALAFTGMDAMVFAWSAVAASLAEAIYGFWITRDQPWLRRPGFRLWKLMLARSQWLILGAFALSNLRQGNYIVLGFFEPKAVLGVYFFAYQIAIQINVLLATNLQQVLFPALTKLKDNPVRHREAILRSSRVMVVAGGAIALGLGVTIDPLEHLIWRGKWEDAVPAVQMMCAFFSLRLLLSVLNSAMISVGKNRQWAMLTLVQGMGLLAVAALAGWLFDEAWEFALVVGAYFATGVLATVAWGLRSVGVPVWSLLKGVIPGWLVALACGLAAIAADTYLFALGVFDRNNVPAALTRLFVFGSGFVVLYVLAMRVLLPKALAETIDVAPGPIRRRAFKLLRIRRPEPVVVAADAPDAKADPGYDPS